MNNTHPWIVVGGAAGGIGLEVLRQLSSQPYKIAVLVLNEQQGDEALAAGAHHAICCDIADEPSVTKALSSLNGVLGNDRLAAVIQCAALQPAAALELTPRRELEALYAVNVFGTFQLIQGLLSRLRGGGRIVLFSSMAGRLTTPMLGAYCSTKHALEALADALRLELSTSEIAVSLIEPGGVATAMASSQRQHVTRGIEAMKPDDRHRYEKLYNSYAVMTENALKKASKPEDVARVAVNAATAGNAPKARYLVGSDAKLLVFLKWLLPTRCLDALLRRLIPS